MKKVFVFFLFMFSVLISAQTPSGGELVGLHNVPTTDLSAILGPIVGSILYNPSDENIYVYKTVGGWTPIGSSDEWKLDGNNITSTNFFGSINAEDLVFKANNTERIRIKQNTGNIGIGTITPNQKLEVNGIIRAGEASSTTGTTIIEGRYSGDNVTAILGTKRSSGNLVLGYGVRPNNTDNNFISSANNVAFQRSLLEVGNGLTFRGTPNQVSVPINSVVTMPELFKILPNGNTGIATSNPQYKLEVNGTAKIEDTPTITNATTVLVKDPTSGQISEQEIPIGLLNGKFLMSFSGRAYYYANRWYSTNDLYGTGYPHWNSYKGAAAAPAYSTVNQHGIPITSEATLAKFTMKNDFNAVPVAPRINLAVIRGSATIDIGTYTINNPSTNITIQTEKIGFTVKEGDLLVWAANSSGGNRLSYAALTFEFTY